MEDRRAFMFFLIVTLVPAFARSQIDTERIPPAQDSSDLYRRAAASQHRLGAPLGARQHSTSTYRARHSLTCPEGQVRVTTSTSSRQDHHAFHSVSNYEV